MSISVKLVSMLHILLLVASQHLVLIEIRRITITTLDEPVT